MEITVNRKSLAAAFNEVAGCVPSRTHKPILTNVMLIARGMFDTPDGEKAGEPGATLIATDLEIGIRRALLGSVNVREGGRVLLPAARFKTILSAATADELTISCGDTKSYGATGDLDKTRIRCGKAKWELPSEDVNLFPEVPAFVATDYHEVAAHDLLSLIKRTIFAVDEESTRYALGGVLFETGADILRGVATCGRRLASATVPAAGVGSVGRYVNLPDKDENGQPTGEQSPVIPARVLKLLSSLLRGDDGPVHISMGAGSRSAVMFRTGAAELYARVMEGRFPRYQDVFPSERYACRLELTAGPLREAIEQAAVATGEKSRGVDVTVTPSTGTNGSTVPASLAFKCQTADVGASDVELEIPDYTGPKAEVTFDPRYVLDMLRAIGDDAAVVVDVDKMGPNLFAVGEGYRYVVMPLTRDR